MDSAAPSRHHDEAALIARRERLRAFAADVADCVEAIPMPESFLEGERAVRTVTIADRILARLPDERAQDEYTQAHASAIGWPERLRLRTYADRLLDTVYDLPKPECFLEAERAGRFTLAADRMLTQLYGRPKPKSSGRYGDEDDMDGEADADTPEEVARKNLWYLTGFISKQTAHHARVCGVWPDGQPFDDKADIAHDAYAPLEHELMEAAPDEPVMRTVAHLLLRQINAISRQQAGKLGHWPDNTPYSDDTPDLYTLSANLEYEAESLLSGQRAEDEEAGPLARLWWIVRRKRDSG